MRDALLVFVALFLSCVCMLLFVEGAGLKGGVDVVVIGAGEKGSNEAGPSPYPSPGANGPTFDPTSPMTPISPPIDNSQDGDSGKKSSNNASANNISASGALFFEMTGGINGTGGFSSWRSVDRVYGLENARLSASAIKGNVTLSDRLIVLSDRSGDDDEDRISISILFAQDDVAFYGNSYRDSDIYHNGGGQIENSISSGQLLKGSAYLYTSMSQLNSSEEPNKFGIFNESTTYRLNTKYIGRSSFGTRFLRGSNITELSEDYTGAMAISRNLAIGEGLNWTNSSDDWLPCCSLVSNGIDHW